VGRQALEVIGALGRDYKVVALSANTNYRLLAEQARRFNPELVVLAGGEDNIDLLIGEIGDRRIRVEAGREALIHAALEPSADIALIAVVGFGGFAPTVAALKAGKRIALANKESLVVGGELLSREVPGFRELIVPVDSEHSAIFQCLRGEKMANVARLILTASGGPFREMDPLRLERVNPEEALKHPRWRMGPKITIDSATLMNKGFEVLEARWLFGIDLDRIKVVVHPQSMVHSLVEFVDGSVKAQIAPPDMRIPIQYALTYPARKESSFPRVDLVEQSWNFEPPDMERFPALEIAYMAGKSGGTMPAVLNAANEIAVDQFLKGRIKFPEITGIARNIMDEHKIIRSPSGEDIVEADRWARKIALNICKAGDR
jgi:1-deoxy-D-xylulose-5-phosphate reductoisomerase